MTRFLTITLCALALPLRAAPDDPAIRFFEERVKNDPEDFIAWNQLAARYHHALRRTGDDRFIALETQAAEQSLKAIPAEENPGGLAGLAQAQLAAHRFADARDSATRLRALQPGKLRPLELLADALIEIGDYTAARKACDDLAGLENSELSAAPRLARLDIVAGRLEEAHLRLAKGRELAANLTPAAADLVAWFDVQLGELAFGRGDFDTAEQHYRAAVEGWPDGYSAEDHLAELHAARGDLPGAIAAYEKLVERVPRPELFQALGDLHTMRREPEKARPWLDRAEESYLRSTAAGAVHYFHHLAGFYADSREDSAKALEWARKDFGLRQSIYAHDSLAWALYKGGYAAAAGEAIERALATGTRDSHLLFHAGLIRMSVGDVVGGKNALQQSTAANPRANTFHVHR